MKIGFSGTRKGFSGFQRRLFKEIIKENINKITEFHHGCCKGADTEASWIVKGLSELKEDGFRVKIVAHPPINSYAVGNYFADEIKPRKPFLVRNKNIVNELQKEDDTLLAAPKTKKSTQRSSKRSSTWMTIKYAKSLNKNVFLL